MAISLIKIRHNLHIYIWNYNEIIDLSFLNFLFNYYNVLIYIYLYLNYEIKKIPTDIVNIVIHTKILFYHSKNNICPLVFVKTHNFHIFHYCYYPLISRLSLIKDSNTNKFTIFLGSLEIKG